MTQQNIVIGLCGRKLVGKDTIADYLVEKHGFLALSYAAPLKRGLLAMLSSAGLEEKHLHDQSLKEVALPSLFDRTPRHLMQTLGTEWGRECISGSLWVELLQHEVAIKQSAGHSKIVVTDCRFLTEEDSLHAMGAQLWYVRRDSAVLEPVHASEHEPIGALRSATITNNGTLDGLYAQVEDILQKAHELHRPHHYSPL